MLKLEAVPIRAVEELRKLPSGYGVGGWKEKMGAAALASPAKRLRHC